MTFVSKRKKYVREMNADWWQKSSFYKLYIVREATALFALWFSIELLYGVMCLGNISPYPTNSIIGFERFIDFLQNPIVMLLNIVTLGMALLNTVTYFQMTPKVLNIVVKGEQLNPKFINGALWAVTALVSVIVLVLVA